MQKRNDNRKKCKELSFLHVGSPLDRTTGVRIWLPAFFKTEEKATEKQKNRSNRSTGSIPVTENEAYDTKMITSL